MASGEEMNAKHVLNCERIDDAPLRFRAPVALRGICNIFFYYYLPIKNPQFMTDGVFMIGTFMKRIAPQRNKNAVNFFALGQIPT